MAQLNQGRVDIISRNNGTLTSQFQEGGSRSVLLTEPSVVKINGTRAMVVEFERQGNDLILHMRDGSVVRYQQFFFDDPEGNHSELVFDDGQHPPEQAIFPAVADGSDLALVTPLTPTYESLSGIEPLLLADNNISGSTLTAAGLGLLGLGGIAVAASSGGGGDNNDNNNGGNPANPGAGSITLNPLSGDGYLNAQEARSGVVVSGMTQGVAAGSTVTLTFNGQTFTAVIGADGRWQTTLPPAVLTGLADGTQTLTARVTDSNGQTVTASGQLIVIINTLPEATLNTPFGDGILNSGESQQDQSLTGTTGVKGSGQTVVVTVGEQSYTGSVDNDGNWSVTLPAGDLQNLPDGTTPIGVTVTDPAGNSSTLTPPAVVTVDSQAPSLSVNPIAADGVLSEAEQGSPLTVSGTGEAGSQVSVTLNGKTYTATVAEGGQWTLDVPAADLSALADGSYTLSVVARDAAGNITQQDAPLVVDTAPPVFAVQPIAGDGIINAAEQGAPLAVSGSGSAGDRVTVTLGDQTYTATVGDNGQWSLTLPAGDLAALSDGTYPVTVTVQDAAGNRASQTLSVTVDTQAPLLTLNAVAGDGILNANEQGSPLTVSGTGEAASQVSVTLNGKTYTATVAEGGQWTLDVPAADLSALADGSYSLSVVARDAAGNTTEQNVNLRVDTTASDFTVNPIAGDGIINAAEQGAPLAVSGSGSAGDRVTVTLGDQTYTATVGDNGQWSLTLPAGDLVALSDGTYPVTVAVQDAAGNRASQTLSVTVDTQAPLLTLNAVAGDGILNANEQGRPLTVSGTGETASQVSVTLNGKTYTATVAEGGQWTLDVPAADLNALADGSYTLSVVARDAAGNITQQDAPLVVDTAPPVFAVQPIAGDGVINFQEKFVPLEVKGSGSAGDRVSLMLGDKTYTTVVNEQGEWLVSVPLPALDVLGEGPVAVSVSVINAAGNQATISAPLSVNTSTPALSIDPVSDGFINADEKQQPLVITGKGEPNLTISVSLDNTVFTTVVGENGS
ncbi:Ig-like domain-containing protein [Pantoea sp. 1.19]|uniref:Ig-like domain-containing protein n=1 Tax=Pantoea sp. 1.19 TaxID=1925589 RepID=UPI0009F883D8|nr:Ig-like domain-containing protein [Pantoea sp. 1.19]